MSCLHQNVTCIRCMTAFRAFWAVVTSRNDLLSRLVSVVLCKCYILISIWHSLFVGAQNAKTLISYGFLKHFGAVVRCRNGVFFSFFHWFCKSFLVISIWPLSSAWMFFSPSKRKSCLRIVFCIIFELWARLEKVSFVDFICLSVHILSFEKLVGMSGGPRKWRFSYKTVTHQSRLGGTQKSDKKEPSKMCFLGRRFSYKTVTFRARLGGTPEI